MNLNSLLYDLLMSGMSIRQLLIAIIVIYVVLRLLFVLVARFYLKKQLPIDKDNKEEQRILSFYVRILDVPLLIYTAFVLYSIFNGNFQVNFLMWYVILLVAIVVIEAVTGVIRKIYVSRIEGEREYTLELEKAQAEKEHNVE